MRQAIALGIDRKQLAENVLNGAYDVPDSIYPPQMPWTVRNMIKTDVAAARRLLDDAGWRPVSGSAKWQSAFRRAGWRRRCWPPTSSR